MANNIKIGDRVRYLNSVGGGIVRSFKNKNIILVEEEDGFETPVLINEVVVIQPTNQYNFPIDTPAPTPTATNTPDTTPDDSEKEITLPPYTWNERNETPDGEKLSLYIAFLPTDIKQIQNSDLELYIINDSNYYIQFAISNTDNRQNKIRHTDTIEPQTKLHIETIDRLSLNEITNLRLQAFAYKKIPFDPKPTIDAPIHINPVKFYKLHTFTDNDFFDQKALITTIIENDILNLGTQIDPVALQNAINNKNKPTPQHQSKPSRPQQPIIEVDLHINQLIDNTNGLSRADMLQLQLDTFEKTMTQNLKNKNQKIIFIHGKGEGILRAEIEKRLKHKYPQCQYSDASFQQYGFGATQVTIK